MSNKEVERFKARSADGKHEVVIVVTQPMIHVGTHDNPHAVMPGLKQARTIDGQPCNHKGGGKFEIVATGIVVEKV